MGSVHVPTLLRHQFQRGYIFDLDSPLLSLWYFSLYHENNIYSERMRRLLSVNVNCISGHGHGLSIMENGLKEGHFRVARSPLQLLLR